MITIHHGNSMEVCRTLNVDSIDSVVCDPPYGLSKEPNMTEVLTHWLAGDDYAATGGGFMGKSWDSFVPGPATWREIFRVLKPGGYALVFAGSRTVDLMAVSLRLAGFEIRDQIQWVYGSGFPKSLDISKALDKQAGAAAQQWQGWGTALKPAHEPIIVARKPLGEGTVAANVLKWGTGGLNIDGCRVPTDDKLGGGAEKATSADQKGNDGWVRPWMSDADAQQAHAGRVRANVEKAEALGRFPANLIHDGSDEVLACFPDAPGQQGVSNDSQRTQANCYGGVSDNGKQYQPRDDQSTSAARFFYCAKASKSDRGEGNTHPTVKPQALMRYLVRLVTPPGGTVLDPFAGSGSTGIAALAEGFRAVLIERETEYVNLIRRRAGVVPSPVVTAAASEPCWGLEGLL